MSSDNDLPIVAAGHYATDMAEIQDKLTRDLLRAGRKAGLAIVIFANAEKDFVKSQILSLYDYWNYRSRDYVTFFFPGFLGDSSDSQFKTRSLPGREFNARAFVEVIEDFESISAWRYRGDTPIIICRGRLKYHEDTDEARAFLDLTSLIEFELERALHDGIVTSVESFFEFVIEAAKKTPGDQVLWDLSNPLMGKTLGRTLIDSICRLPFASEVRQTGKAVEYFRVQGFS